MNEILCFMRISYYPGANRINDPCITSIENPECSHVLYFLDSKHQSFVTDIGFRPFRFFGASFRPVNQGLGSLFVRAVAVTSRKDSGKVAGSGGTHAALRSRGFAPTIAGQRSGTKPSVGLAGQGWQGTRGKASWNGKGCPGRYPTISLKLGGVDSRVRDSQG